VITVGSAAARWSELQSGRGIPPEILAAAPRSPWGHDPADFAPPEEPADTPSRTAALALLGACGTVLDVGCGGGDAAFALVGPMVEATGVDAQQDMLDLFESGADVRGVPVRTVLGRWPEVAEEAGPADLVVCHHVLHNVVDLGPFVAALTAAARRGVVVEMLAEHPMAWLDPLWEHFHDLRRPEPATVEDAVAVLREAGIDADVVRWDRERRHPHDPAWVTRRLCLPEEREPEVRRAMADIPPRAAGAATLTWRP
jgi:SAM-dependent methyltransferase